MGYFRGILSLFASRAPSIIKAILLHVSGLGANSDKWRLIEAILVRVRRDDATRPLQTITEQQELTASLRRTMGSAGICNVTLPSSPEDAARRLVFDAFRNLRDGNEELIPPLSAPVEAEWTVSVMVSFKRPGVRLTKKFKFREMMKKTTSDITVLYFHGGLYVDSDPASCRDVVSLYARCTGGRVLSVRYRLAPQNPFPAALVDGLMAYLSLLHPPRGSLHGPVPASRIVIAGDEAGGGLALALLQTLLQARRDAYGEVPRIVFHGKEVELLLPAGIVAGSPLLDLTYSLRTSKYHASCDYIPVRGAMEVTPPPCPAWPSNPPREHFFCQGNTLCHPLVSPLAAQSWVGAPPVMVIVGEELAAEESKAWARRAIGQGVKVVWEQYEVMPHCFWHFATYGHRSPIKERCFKGWSRFVRGVTGEGDADATATREGKFLLAKTAEAQGVTLATLEDVEHEAIVEQMRKARDELIERRRV